MGLHPDDVTLESEEDCPVERVIARKKLVELAFFRRSSLGCHLLALIAGTIGAQVNPPITRPQVGAG